MLTIVDPAERTDLTTLEAVRAAGVTVGTDQQIGEAISRASSAIVSYCGRRFERVRVRETRFTVPRSPGPIALGRWPVMEVHSIAVNGEALAADRHWIDGSVLHVEAAGRIEIEYSAGYLLPGGAGRDLPGDIEHAAIRLVAQEMHGLGRDPSIRSEDVDGVSNLSFFGSGSTSNAILAALVSYRQPVAV